MIHFPADALPKVEAFWSVTLYAARHNLVKNPINRYAMGQQREARSCTPVWPAWHCPFSV
jgi:hypothetical protein